MPTTDTIQQPLGGVLTDQTLGVIRTTLVTPTFASATVAGPIAAQGAVTVSPGSGVTIQPAVLTTNGAISPHVSATYMITKAGVYAGTIAAPTATVDDGVTITITSNTADAHTITMTGLMQSGTATVNLATFAAFAGASITFYAYQGKWNVLSLNAVVLT